MTHREKGSALEGVLILIGLLAILVFFVLPQKGVLGPANGFKRVTNPATYQEYAASRSQDGSGLADSSYANAITVGQGNAAYAIDPVSEYITIENTGSSLMNISGWKLVNNKSNRTYYAGNQKVSYASDVATIPQGVGYVSPTGFNLLQNIVLKPGERAIVTTGSVGVQTPYSVVSFKENECSGYLEALPQYDFTPTLSRRCVPAAEEPGVEALDRACQNFLSAIATCETPKLGGVDSAGRTCDNCVDGQPASSDACFHFIKDHYSYAACIDHHQTDANFYLNTWRVFLGKQWEMWDKSDEIISLFDQFNKLVAYKAY